MTFRPDISPLPNLQPTDELDWLTQPLDPYVNPEFGPDEQLASAHYVAGALRASIRYLHKSTRHENAPGDIDLQNAWLADVVHAMVRGRQITIEPGRLSIRTDSQTNEIKPLTVDPIDHAAIALTGLFRNIVPREHQICVTTVVNDSYDKLQCSFLGQKGLPVAPRSVSERRQFTRDARGFLLDEDVLRHSDRAGKDFTFFSLASRIEKITQPGGLIYDLHDSDWGEVKTMTGKALRFEPSEELLTICSRPNFPARSSQLKGMSLLYRNGQPDITASRADTIRQVLRQTSGPHISLQAFPNSTPYDPDFMFLRAVDSIDQQRYHTIGINPHDISPGQLALAVAKKLEYHTHEFIASRNRFDSFDSFDPYEYAERNYGGEQALVDDQDICRLVSFTLNTLGIQARAAADIGCGPNPYPGMLLLPHSDRLDLLEYSKPNREYMDAFFRGTLPLNHTNMWHKFETYMVEGGGEKYAGVFDAIGEGAHRRQVEVRQGDIFNLPKKSWDIISSYFVTDSISIYRGDYRQSLDSLRGALKDEGLLITANMLNRADHIGYNAGNGKTFPNISQTAHQIKQSYLDADMFSIVIPTGGKRKARDGYDGMALVLACHKHANLKQKLKALIPSLQQRTGQHII